MIVNQMKNNTVIVEFNGLPGLGKTTVAEFLIKRLNEKGYKTVNRYYRRNILYTLHHPFPELFNLSLYRLVKSYSAMIPPINTKRTHVHWINFYVQKYLAIQKYSDADFAIIDEAIIQFWVAIAFQDRMPKSKLVESIISKIKQLGIQFIRVDCIHHIDEAADRIISRPQKGMMLENLPPQELKRTLEVEAYNFDYLRSVFSQIFEGQQVITIDTLSTPEENVKIIEEVLLHRR